MKGRSFQYKRFKILIKNNREKCDDDLWFLLDNGNILLKETEEKFSIPFWKDIRELYIDFSKAHCFGCLENRCCYTVEVDKYNLIDIGEFKFVPLYESGSLLGEEFFGLSGMANQILFWDLTHKFCGKCGGKLENKEEERAKICNKCNLPIYPVICPAIIVSITKGDKILLAHNTTFKDNMYSVIAGFVDPGESLEDCVKREVYEEVKIRVKNIRYYGNQPWGFPNALMIAFVAEYESGEIDVDGKEIVDAGWFKKEELPNLPQKMSIARKMIDSFINNEY